MPQKPQARAKDKRRLTKRLANWRAKQASGEAVVAAPKPAAKGAAPAKAAAPAKPAKPAPATDKPKG